MLLWGLLLLLVPGLLLLGILRVLLLGSVCRVWTVCTLTTSAATPVLLCSELGILVVCGVGVLDAGVGVVPTVCGGGHGRRVCQVPLDHGWRAWFV